MTSIQKIDIEVQSLATCAYKHEIFEEILQRIQKAVDELNLHSYSNLNSWVKTLDEQVSRPIFLFSFQILKGVKGCVRYIFASLFFKSKLEHLSNWESCFLFHFKISFRSQENQILEFYISFLNFMTSSNA